MAASEITILDGGMGRELLRIGAPFRQPEWSALALMEGPEWVVRAHRNFIDAGAQVITTNSYACVPFHLGAEVFAVRGSELAELAGTLARAAAEHYPEGQIAVAGSIPPVCGSYRPDLFDAGTASKVLSVLVDALAPSVDLWLIETIGSIDEATTALRVVRGAPPRPVWLSFTLDDRAIDPARLRSGESIVDAAGAVGSIDALLFNCSQPEVMASAVRQALAAVAVGTRVGVYANAFTPMADEPAANEALSVVRDDLSPSRYAAFAAAWVAAGATIIGGCCGIGPEHIAALI